jgi:hypothetical protein
MISCLTEVAAEATAALNDAGLPMPLFFFRSVHRRGTCHVCDARRSIRGRLATRVRQEIPKDGGKVRVLQLFKTS